MKLNLKNYDLNKIYEWPITVQLVLLSVLAIFIFYLGYILSIRPLYNNIIQAKNDEFDLKNSFKTAVENRMHLQNDLKYYPKMKETISLWKKNIITQKELPSTLDSLIKLGEDSHVKINLFDPGAEIKDAPYYKVPVKIEIAGTYDQIASFISQIANYSKLVLIGNFIITKEGQANSNDSNTTKMIHADTPLIAQLSLEIYRS